MRNEIVITVNGKNAVLTNTVPLNTGNAGSMRVRFVVDPEDKVWKDKALWASFRAVTHIGAVLMEAAAVDFKGIAVIPAQMLRERAVRFEVGLGGISQVFKEAGTNVVNLGRVAQGAGGEGFFQDCDCGFPTNCAPHRGCHNAGMWERMWRAIMAKFAGVEPLLRHLYAIWPTLREIAETEFTEQEILQWLEDGYNAA